MVTGDVAIVMRIAVCNFVFGVLGSLNLRLARCYWCQQVVFVWGWDLQVLAVHSLAAAKRNSNSMLKGFVGVSSVEESGNSSLFGLELFSKLKRMV
ncbi:hypothetical protein Glove_9g375 [Diversispora epigaea]|uniref:Uncharacterized protein n=1 Tax=Diversispora epigaea TaxID=1348612 RepID=A0A397JNK3_9GLOM|nr:hypothetical protein Glove_9g375 [Diversispora epigaea]